jgi:hypothetical protein
MRRRECKLRNGKTQKRRIQKLAAGPSDQEIPADHSAQKTELLGWLPVYTN